jgi:hypothetical protein
MIREAFEELVDHPAYFGKVRHFLRPEAGSGEGSGRGESCMYQVKFVCALHY